MSPEKDNLTSNNLPLVALVGPTNAGKSTLFNRLTGGYQAVTAKEEATTRDRVYGLGNWQNRYFNLVDTAGLVDETGGLHALSREQMEVAAKEADLILFAYDGRGGLTQAIKDQLNIFRKTGRVWLVANKVDSYEVEEKLKSEDHLGLPFYVISARTGRRVGDLADDLIEKLKAPTTLPKHNKPMIALLGRPNVGKSTLLNALTETDRAIVSTIPGTTRDVVTANLEIDGDDYLVADTAGVRRRGKIVVGAELFSLKRTANAIAESDAVLILIDAAEGTTRGDLHMLDFAKDLRKPILLVFNKADLLDESGFTKMHPFLQKYDQVSISALNRTGLEQIIDWIKEKTKKS